MLKQQSKCMALFIALVAAATVGCGDDAAPGVGVQGTLVGGPCVNATECSGGSCLSGGDFPQGTCSVRCSSDAQCPAGSSCVDKVGGHCLQSCQLSSECRGGYECKGKERVDKSGEVLVCIE